MVDLQIEQKPHQPQEKPIARYRRARVLQLLFLKGQTKKKRYDGVDSKTRACLMTRVNVGLFVLSMWRHALQAAAHKATWQPAI